MCVHMYTCMCVHCMCVCVHACVTLCVQGGRFSPNPMHMLLMDMLIEVHAHCMQTTIVHLSPRLP